MLRPPNALNHSHTETPLPKDQPIAPQVTNANAIRRSSVRVLIVVEGTTDVAFLENFSAMLAASDATLPDLALLAAHGKAVFLPFGGGNVASWRDRLAPLDVAEFHLYDGELPPETAVRQRAAALVSGRPNCQAAVTSKRSLENFLHPAAIAAAGGPPVAFSDTDDVALVVTQARHRQEYTMPWYALPRRQRRALVHKTKRWLMNAVVRHMTPELLAERDPSGEVRGWLRTIRELGQFGDG